MRLVLFFAVILALLRGGSESGWLANKLILMTLGVLALGWSWFLLVPKRSLKLALGDRTRQRRILRWVVATPAPAATKLLARYLLGLNEQANGCPGDAEATYRSILVDCEGKLDPGFESTVRQHLADTVEARGRHEEAAAERERASAVIRDENETWLRLQARGKLLEDEHRHAEAVAVFERSFELAPPNKAIRDRATMHLVLSSFNAGRPAETVRWAEAVIELDPHGPFNSMARRMAAVGCNNLGRLNDAEHHARLACELAPSAKERAESLALLGDYVMRSGDLDESERVAWEAESILPGQIRMPWVVIGTIEQHRGHYGQAIRAFEHSRTISIGHIPAINRRADAAIDKELAVLYADLGRGDEALALIARAEPELTGDPKLGVTLDAAAALVHALGHDRDRALARVESAEQGRTNVPEDSLTQRSALYLLGRAALALDEPERAGAFLCEYLDRGPDSIYQPYAWYHLGECRRRLGDEAGGLECDRQAGSARFGTLWERLARVRLAAAGVAV
jgi:tetratricopeptide (TPR) repeat protein